MYSCTRRDVIKLNTILLQFVQFGGGKNSGDGDSGSGGDDSDEGS